jgi:hypothetical protein
MAKPAVKVQKTTVEGTVVKLYYPALKKGVQVDVGTFSEKLLLAAALHGVKQRLGDAESGGSAAEKYEMAQRIIDEAFAQDSWDLTTRTVDPKLVIEAVASVMGKTEDEIRAVLERLGEEAPERIKEWRGKAKVKAKILEIQAARAKAKADEAEDDDEPNLD